MTGDPLYLGIDGGTSRSEAFVVDQSGEVTGSGVAGPLNNPDGDGHHPCAAKHAATAIRAALAEAGADVADVTGAWFAVSGGPQWLTEPLARLWLAGAGVRPSCRLSISDDHLPVWAAAGYPDPCVWVLLGTYWGSRGVVDGIEREHPLDDNDLDVLTAARADPHWLGSALLATCVERLVTGRPDRLVDAVLGHLGADGLPGVLAWSRAHVGTNERAALLPLLVALADGGEETAAALLTDAGRQLAAATCLMLAAWGLLERPATILLAGNAWRAGARLVDPFLAGLGAQAPLAAVLRPRATQAQGAALLAMRQAVPEAPRWLSPPEPVVPGRPPRRER